MLEILGLTKSHGLTPSRPLFDGISLRLARGECVAITGESGAGKSTLLNCIAGLETVDRGKIVLDGTELTSLDETAFAHLRRKAFGFVFQAFHVLPHLTVAQNVALPLWLQGVAEKAAAHQAYGMVERVGLGGRGDDWPRHLSGGELQRVAIARALVHRPTLVLADEPTGNLDPERAADILDLLLERIRDANAMGIIVTHSAAAARRAGRILRLGRNILAEVSAES